MRLIPSDPDVRTVVERIKDGSLDLQPDFQRGSVWPASKQRLLIDSILRQWYVPPIHVVRTDDERQVVLDGQQRLQAIYDFASNNLTVEGRAEPVSESIWELDRKTYSTLPDPDRRRFDRFTLRMFEVIDYSAEEPYELFFRLNQPTTLTSAEKRNAFFGPARTQIAALTEHAQVHGMTQARIGFSNARLAYEDVLARFACTLEHGALDEKVTAARVTHRYRNPEPFDDSTVNLANETVSQFMSLNVLDETDVRLNRAMVHTWLCFTARSLVNGEDLLRMDEFVYNVESGRQGARSEASQFYVDAQGSWSLTKAFRILNDRATSRVGDVASVLLRDAAVWGLRSIGRPSLGPPHEFGALLNSAAPDGETEQDLLRAIERSAWGRFR